MSEASGSYRTGHSGTPCTAGKGTKNTVASSIYTGPLCAFLGTLLALAQTQFFFFQTSGGGEGGKRVEWQIMISLCLAFDKYLLVRRALSSIPFHFTNKLEIH